MGMLKMIFLRHHPVRAKPYTSSTAPEQYDAMCWVV